MILDNGPIFYSILGLCVLNNLASPIRTIGKETTKVRNFRGRELVLETAARIINWGYQSEIGSPAKFLFTIHTEYILAIQWNMAIFSPHHALTEFDEAFVYITA